MTSLDRFTGALLGLATGDALGAPHEGGPLERLLWRAIGRTRDGCARWTDDTQMARDLAESLLADGGVLPDAIARRFATSYRWSRGYGPGVTRILKRVRRGEGWEQAANSVYPGGSYGNGAAMRAPVVALFFANDRGALVDAARTTARITHSHPLGVEGAVLVAVATHALLAGRSPRDVLGHVRDACRSREFAERLAEVETMLDPKEATRPRAVAKRLGNGTAALTSVPTALWAALRHVDRPFAELTEFVIACRGDVDTIGAMAGAMWGAANGAGGLPSIALEARRELVDLAARLYARHGPITSPSRGEAT